MTKNSPQPVRKPVREHNHDGIIPGLEPNNDRNRERGPKPSRDDRERERRSRRNEEYDNRNDDNRERRRSDKPRRNDDRDRDNYRNSDRERDNYRNNDRERNNGIDHSYFQNSPTGVKLNNGSSILNMHGNNEERSVKARRDSEYQALLLKQIEEKKRIKEEEKRKLDKIKKKELEEYMGTQYKGLRPVHNDIIPGLEPNNNNLDYDLSPRREKKMSSPNLEDRYRENEYNDKKSNIRRNDKNNYDDDDYNGGNNRDNNRINSIKKERKGVQNSFDSVDYENNKDSSYYSPSNRKKSYKKKHYDHDYQDNYDNDQEKGSNNFNQQAYDDLVILCNKLMTTQEELRSEITEQASIIKELQNDKKKSVIPTSRIGSRSVAAKPGAPTKPTVGFGSRVTQSRKIGETNVAEKNSNLSRSKSAATNSRKKPVTKDNIVISSNKEIAGKNRPNSMHSNKVTNNELKNESSFEHDYISPRLNNNAHNLMKQSIELQGNSEYLKIGAGQIDVISADELDRLLSNKKLGNNKNY
jgi:hypothetical protein